MPTRDFSTLIDLLDGARDVHPSRGIRLVSAQFRESYCSYAELHRRVLFHAEHLREQDIGAGQKVVVPLTTDLDLVGSFLALIWLGAVPVSVTGQMAGQERGAYLRRLKDLMERYQFDRIVLDTTLAQAVVDDQVLDPRLVADPYPQSVDPDREPPRIAAASPRPDDLAFIQYSSGSTSDPKGVQITHRNICANLKIIVENDGRTEESSGIVWMPLYHDMGLVGGFLSPMVHYHPLVLMNPVCFLMKPVSWLDYVSRYRGTVSPVPNFALDMCVTRIRDHQLEKRKPDLGSLAYLYNGSEPVSGEVIERFYERFAPYGLRRGVVHPVYGMAETTLIVTAPDRSSPLRTRDIDGVRVVSVGRPQGDFEIRIVAEDGGAAPPGSVGEIAIRGACVTPGYYLNDEENARRFVDGWFHTGDLGLIEPGGEMFITGRIKDLIIVNGKNFYAHDIAAKIEELLFVRRGKTHVFSFNIGGREEVVVMTVLASRMSSAVRGRVEQLKEFLSHEPGSWLLSRLGEQAETFIRAMNPRDVEMLKDELKQYLLREFGLPIHDVFIAPNMPRTTSGKIRRGEAEALYREYLKSESGS